MWAADIGSRVSVWRRSGWNAALTVFAAQLALNAIWTPLFFGVSYWAWVTFATALNASVWWLNR